MKKRLLFLLLFWTNLSFGQISIDTFIVYNTGPILDSFYLKTTSQGPVFSEILLPSFLDICGTVLGIVYYKGCDTGQSITFDTMCVYGYPSSKMSINTYWDTSATCPQPLTVTPTDFRLWNQCDNWGLEEEVLNQSFTLVPNPTNGMVSIKNSKQIEIRNIQLVDQFGRIVKQLDKNQEIFDLYPLENGVFFFEIETPKGIVVKRILLK